MMRAVPWIIAAAAIAEALRARRVAARERALTEQFCFDSFAFSRLWQDELTDRRERESGDAAEPVVVDLDETPF